MKQEKRTDNKKMKKETEKRCRKKKKERENLHKTSQTGEKVSEAY